MAFTEVLARTQREGTHISSSVLVPGGVSRIYARALMTDAAVLTPGTTIVMSVERSFDGGANWSGMAAITWTSGPHNVAPPGAADQSTPRPGLVVTLTQGERVRGVVDISPRTSIGLEVELS